MSKMVIKVSIELVSELKKRYPNESIENTMRLALGMPKALMGRRRKYRLIDLEVGDSATFHCSCPADYRSVYNAKRNTERKFKMKFRYSFVGGIATVTRVR